MKKTRYIDYSHRNPPIATMLRNYEERKKGCVQEARRELQWRFDFLDWSVQRRTMLAMLQGTKGDRDWACHKMYHRWDKSFLPLVKKAREQYHEEKASWLIIKYAEIDYLLKKENSAKFNYDGNNLHLVLRLEAEDQVKYADMVTLMREHFFSSNETIQYNHIHNPATTLDDDVKTIVALVAFMCEVLCTFSIEQFESIYLDSFHKFRYYESKVIDSAGLYIRNVDQSKVRKILRSQIEKIDIDELDIQVEIPRLLIAFDMLVNPPVIDGEIQVHNVWEIIHPTLCEDKASPEKIAKLKAAYPQLDMLITSLGGNVEICTKED